MWLIELLRELLSALFSELFPSVGEHQQRRRRRGLPTGNASAGDERSQEGAEEEEGCAPLTCARAVLQRALLTGSFAPRAGK